MDMLKLLSKPFLLIAFGLLVVAGGVKGMPSGLPDKATAAQQTAAARRDALQVKLDAVHLKACQDRQNAITRIMANIVERGTNQIDVFNTIAERVEAFYTDKGKTLAGYDDLVTAVNDAKTKAQTDLDTMQSSSTSFDCTADNPKGMGSLFLTNLKTEIEDLQAYRTAIKDLIVGVKSVQGTTSSSENNAGAD